MTYASGGDIYAVDPGTGRSTAIVKGPGDINPRWSGDGTRLAFERQEVASGPGLLFVTGADGSDPIQVTPQPLLSIDTYSFSPDGKEILITATSARGIPGVFIAEADGSGIRQLDLPGRATDAAWRPPDGSEILFMDNGDDSDGTDSSIYAVNALDGKVRTILPGADAAGRFRGHPAWSPDGSHDLVRRMHGCEWHRRPDPHHHGGRDPGSHPSDPDRRRLASAVYLVE